MKFLHRLDSLECRLMMVDTNVRHLRIASFLDGREQFWHAQSIGDAGLLGTLNAGQVSRQRARAPGWIFHVGFCGSTLLTRLLEGTNDVLCLREPQCMVDLSDQLDAIRRRGPSGAPEVWLGRVSAHFAGLGGRHGQVVVKPSNWANPLLPALEHAQLLDHAVFVTMERRAWLRACLRGGRARLAYVARCVDHTVRASNGYAGLLTEAVSGTSDPLDQVVRLAALLDAVQNAQFDQIDPGRRRRIDYARIVDDPEGSVHDVRAMLGLSTIRQAVATVDWHAKDPARRFDAEVRSDEDIAVDAEHGDRIEAAMEWIDGALGAQLAPARSRA